eukprot:1150312-Pelagomonas_calceolata.AAC.7
MRIKEVSGGMKNLLVVPMNAITQFQVRFAGMPYLAPVGRMCVWGKGYTTCMSTWLRRNKSVLSDYTEWASRQKGSPPTFTPHKCICGPSVGRRAEGRKNGGHKWVMSACSSCSNFDSSKQEWVGAAVTIG